MSNLELYFTLSDLADEMVSNGTSYLDPVVRSICRKIWKLRRSLSPEEQGVVFAKEDIYFG